MTRLSIPRRLEEVSPDWMQEVPAAVGASDPTLIEEVVIETIEGLGLMATLARCRLVYGAARQPDAPETVIV